MEPLHEVFLRTAKCLNPTKSALSMKDVSDSLRRAISLDAVTGVVLTHRTVEVTVTTDVAYDQLLAAPIPLGSSSLTLDFVPAFSDNFWITLYNVPIGSSGCREKHIIEAAGARVLDYLVVRHPLDTDHTIATGERRYRCTSRHTFTYLPLVVTSYNGRKMGCRYRGQAHDLATKSPSLLHPSDSALSSHSIWADGHPPFSSPHVPGLPPVSTPAAPPVTTSSATASSVTSGVPPTSTASLTWGEQMELGDSKGPPPITVTAVIMPPVTVAAPILVTASGSLSSPVLTSPSPLVTVVASLPVVTTVRSSASALTTTTASSTRSRSSDRELSAATGEPVVRERSPLKVHNSPPNHRITWHSTETAAAYEPFHDACTHKCPDCPEKFSNYRLYQHHVRDQHGEEHNHRCRQWSDLQVDDPNAYARRSTALTCLYCNNLFYDDSLGRQPPLCHHECPELDCSDTFPTQLSYNTHLQKEHLSMSCLIDSAWSRLKASDFPSFQEKLQKATCLLCTGIYYDTSPLPDIF